VTRPGRRPDERDRRHQAPPPPRRVTASLPAAARGLGAEGAVELAAVAARWAELVGAQVAVHAWPQSLRQGVLVVATDHHAWASELRALAGQLVKRAQAEGLAVGSITVSVSHRERPGW
jgi:predicted nucleic acid-binding Zn ribbon protein